jgi:hypothetical protein
MKNKISLLVALATLLTSFAFGQTNSTKPVDLITQSKTAAISFQDVNLFNLDLITSKTIAGVEDNIEDYNLFDLKTGSLESVIKQRPVAMTMTIPVNFTNSFELELVAVDIFSSDFTVIQRSDNSVADVTHGVHYRGIIKGDNSSVAAISIFGDEVMGLISSNDGNLVIGKLQNQSSENKHIIYDDFNVITDIGLECGTEDDGIGYKKKDLEFDASTKDIGDCIRLYIEVDKDIHDNKGGVTAASNYAEGLLNQVITLYGNENISSVVSQIVVWDVTSPYSSNSSSGMLSDFQANTGSFNGDLGQLLSYQASGGIAAGFAGICNSNSDNSLSFSSIDASYSTAPTYSWSVMVVTHEFGHLWGSRHTHACVWNGNNTAIDGCSGSTEGSCALPGYPSQGGTLMSYCHLQSVGINFNEGFGQQPGDVIRNSVANATCTAPCGPPTCTDGIQNGDETGVDCGAPGCPDCPTCFDTIQNGDETGVDCGGPDCAPCPCNGTNVTLTIVLDNYPEETSWQIKDGGTVVASGGTYGSQPDGSTVVELTCLADGCYDFVIYDAYGDGICCAYGSGSYSLVDNSDDSTLASGGAFTSSETTNFCVGGGSGPILGCTDPTAHNYNSNATQDDGSCETCSDGVQNGTETGVDCGGGFCAPCSTGCNYVTIDNTDFESGWEIWNDGGSDCRRSIRDAAYATGDYCVRLRDNTSSSVATTDILNLSSYSELTVDFGFYARSMENNEDFWLQISTDGGSTYATEASWSSGTDFNNNQFYTESVVITGSFTSNTRLRFRCDASGNSDYVYIDDIVISGCQSGTGLTGPETEVEEKVESTDENSVTLRDLNLFPNPVKDQLTVSFDLAKDADVSMMITDLQGKRMIQQEIKASQGKMNTTIDVSAYSPGMYLVHLVTTDGHLTKKFIVIE